MKRLLKSANIINYFDSVTFSCELGVYKPNPAMYKDALAKMGLLSEQTMFIDDYAICLEGAEKAGILPMMICRENNPRKIEQNRYRMIRTLAELTE